MADRYSPVYYGVSKVKVEQAGGSKTIWFLHENGIPLWEGTKQQCLKALKQLQ